MNHTHAHDQMPPSRMAPLIAFLSFFAPGLGHILIGLWQRGLVWFASFLVYGLTVGATRSGTIWIVSGAVAVDAFVLAITAPENPYDSENDPKEDLNGSR